VSRRLVCKRQGVCLSGARAWKLRGDSHEEFLRSQIIDPAVLVLIASGSSSAAPGGIGGAKGKGRRHKGIAIAEASGDSAPRLIRAGHVWSREEVLGWLSEAGGETAHPVRLRLQLRSAAQRSGEYLLGEAGIPTTAREFWAYVESRSGDEDLGAASFLEQVAPRHFYFGIADGVKSDFMRFRQCDRQLNRQGGRKTASAFDAIGAAQVAKASFSGMRLLHRIDGKAAIWPMDPLPERGSAIVEIYTRIYLRRAGMSGTKLRSRADLNRALTGLGSKPVRLRFEPNDHQTDALITAAGMRALASEESEAFAPPGLTPHIARTEGWTFGIL
jgi:hypothetical protein